jgi:hypothetical protein
LEGGGEEGQRKFPIRLRVWILVVRFYGVGLSCSLYFLRGKKGNNFFDLLVFVGFANRGRKLLPDRLFGAVAGHVPWRG